MAYRLKKGAPPDSELYVRVGLQRTWKPKLGPEFYPAISAEDNDGEEIPEPTNMLEVMLYDKSAIEDGMSSISELLDSWGSQNDNPEYGDVDFTRHTWEIVDKYGNVWSEEYDSEEEEFDNAITYHPEPHTGSWEVHS